MVEVVDNGAKNLLNTIELSTIKSLNTSGTWNGNAYTFHAVTFLFNADGSISVSGTPEGTTTLYLAPLSSIGMVANVEYIGYGLDGGTSNYYVGLLGITGVSNLRFYDANRSITTADLTNFTDVIVRIDGSAAINTTFHPMICTKAQFNISPTYEPYALGNQYLTPELIELCDSGAKNLLTINQAATSTSAGNRVFMEDNMSLPAGTYVFSLTENASSVPSSGNVIQFSLTYSDSTTESMPFITTKAKTRLVVTYTFTKQVKSIGIYAGYVGCSLIDIMCCTKAAFSVSPKFVPYRPNYDLVGTIALQNYPKSIEPCDFNTLVDTGYYIVNQSGSTNLPWSHGEKIFLRVIRFDPGNAQNVMQIGWSFNNAAAEYCVRNRYLGTWGSWYIYQGTAFS